MQLRKRRIASERERRGIEASRSSGERNARSGWNKWFARAKGKQNSTHDSHRRSRTSVVRKLASTSYISDDCPRLAFCSFIRERVSTRGPSKFNGRGCWTKAKIYDLDETAFNELLLIPRSLCLEPTNSVILSETSRTLHVARVKRLCGRS